jgi:hypothetical protein
MQPSNYSVITKIFLISYLDQLHALIDQKMFEFQQFFGIMYLWLINLIIKINVNVTFKGLKKYTTTHLLSIRDIMGPIFHRTEGFRTECTGTLYVWCSDGAWEGLCSGPKAYFFAYAQMIFPRFLIPKIVMYLYSLNPIYPPPVHLSIHLTSFSHLLTCLSICRQSVIFRPSCPSVVSQSSLEPPIHPSSVSHL